MSVIEFLVIAAVFLTIVYFPFFLAWLIGKFEELNMHYIEAAIRYYLARYIGWGKTRKH